MIVSTSAIVTCAMVAASFVWSREDSCTSGKMTAAEEFAVRSANTSAGPPSSV